MMQRPPAIAAIVLIALVTLFLAQCGPKQLANSTPFNDQYRFSSTRQENPSKMILFTTISPQWYMYKAEYLASIGVRGAMMNQIMASWESDIWRLPNSFVPDAPAGRIVGDENALLQLCKEMNAVCAQNGITENSIKVAYYTRLPDWFDNKAWARATENFRQCAIFARDAGFRGVTIDIEYISEMYNLDWTGYDSVGYTRRSDEQMLAIAERRGYDIISAMLDEYPDMVNWHLPESLLLYGPLAGAHVRGMIRALAERDAPGGFHLSTEGTYTLISPNGIVSIYAKIMNSLTEQLDEDLLSYWNRRCSINPGLWPLGYYRDVRNDDGKLIGYTGRQETFHDAIVGSYADKSSNYSVDNFRQQLGTVLAFGGQYFWIYCHGQVLWKMTPQEMTRFHGSTSDTLAVDPNLEGYIHVMRQAEVISDPHIIEGMHAAKQGRRPQYMGIPPAWQVSGMYLSTDSDMYRTAYEPETNSDAPELNWKIIQPESDGLVDLRKHVDGRAGVLVYGKVDFTTDRDMQAVFRFGSNDWGSIFFDGKKIFEYAAKSGRLGAIDQDNFVMNITEGHHRVLIKCGDLGGSAWRYFFRITDMKGETLDGIRWGG